MPSFDDFSVWDDILHPFFLSIAVYISSFGLTILLVIGMVWFAWSTITEQMKGSLQSTSTITESEKAKKHVEDLLNKYKKQNEGRTSIQVGEDGLTEGQRNNLDEEAEFQQLNDLATNYKKQQAESIIGKTPEEKQKEMQALGVTMLRSLGIFIILFIIAFLWGLFYFPAACAVAGYTRSFMATINPLVGLDTIKRLGVDYWKVFGISILISIMSGMAGFLLAVILFPLNLPTFGNIPAQFLSSFITFYFAVVFSVTIGLALYKNSEKLNLYRG
jgi:hypothetical protein